MSNIWGPIELESWRELPCICGRPATEADIAKGIAVFAIPSGSSASEMQLPFCALQKMESGENIPVVAIQAEKTDGQTFIGVRYLEGGNGVCTLPELEMLDDPDSIFQSRT